jgi:hypothetical protein
MSFRESRIEVLWERLVRATFDRLTRRSRRIDVRERKCLARASRWRIGGPYHGGLFGQPTLFAELQSSRLFAELQSSSNSRLRTLMLSTEAFEL